MWNLIPWNKSRSERSGDLMLADPIEREFNRMREDFQSLFQRLWNDSPFFSDPCSGDRWPQWRAEADETDTHYVVRMDAPGFEVGDFDVKLSGNRLTVFAERKESKGGNGSSFQRYGEFSRSWQLPEGAQADQIAAQYRNGVLELQIPKGQEAQNVKRIEVKSA